MTKQHPLWQQLNKAYQDNETVNIITRGGFGGYYPTAKIQEINRNSIKITYSYTADEKIYKLKSAHIVLDAVITIEAEISTFDKTSDVLVTQNDK